MGAGCKVNGIVDDNGGEMDKRQMSRHIPGSKTGFLPSTFDFLNFADIEKI